MTLDTNDCEVQVRCVLLQEQPDKTTKRTGYYSPSLRSAKRVNDMTQREYLSIVEAVLVLTPYLDGTRSTIRSDNTALK